MQENKELIQNELEELFLLTYKVLDIWGTTNNRDYGKDIFAGGVRVTQMNHGFCIDHDYILEKIGKNYRITCKPEIYSDKLEKLILFLTSDDFVNKKKESISRIKKVRNALQ